jgi:hypothetical protein
MMAEFCGVRVKKTTKKNSENIFFLILLLQNSEHEKYELPN